MAGWALGIAIFALVVMGLVIRIQAIMIRDVETLLNETKEIGYEVRSRRPHFAQVLSLIKELREREGEKGGI